MRIIYNEHNTTIYNSYLLKNDADIGTVALNILRTRRDRGFPLTRTATSYIYEIKAHNRLYKLGLFKKHTKDCDLEEPIKK